MIGEEEEGGVNGGNLDTYNSCDWVEVSHTAMSRQAASIEAPNFSGRSLLVTELTCRGGGLQGPVLSHWRGMGCSWGDDWMEHQGPLAVTACTAGEAESKIHPDRLERSCDAFSPPARRGHRVCSVSGAGAHPLGTMWMCDCAPACRSPPSRLSVLECMAA